MKKLKNIAPIFIVIILSYFAIKPFFLPWFFPIHDDTQVQRVFEMHKSLSDGMFPVRWVSDLGYNYGYPIFNFYAPLVYYIGAGSMFFGFDALVATKIMMVLGIILSGVFMYLLAKEFWGRGGGLISAVLYLFAPYHALNIYVRGDVAEFYAYAFIPLVFWGLWKIYKQEKWMHVIVASLAFAAIILSHNLTAMMIAPFIFVFSVILSLKAKNKTRSLLFLSLFLGIIISSFYTLPVFSEMKYTNVLSQIGGGADFRDHFVCPIQLWDSPWGFGGSTPTCVDGLSFKIGKLHILFFLSSLVSLFFFIKKQKLKFWIGVFSILSVFLAAFLTLNYSFSIWNSIPQMAFIQYPWRFLIVIVFFISFIGGSVVLLLRKFPRLFFTPVVLLVTLAIVYFNAEIFTPQTVLNKTANDYTNDYHLRFTTSKISDEYMPVNFYKPKNFDEIPSSVISETKDIKIVSESKKTKKVDTKIIALKETEVLANLAYFPAWKVYVDGVKKEYSYSDRGLLIKIPQGEHDVRLEFVQTPIEKLGNLLSIAGILILIIGIIIFQRQTSKSKV